MASRRRQPPMTGLVSIRSCRSAGGLIGARRRTSTVARCGDPPVTPSTEADASGSPFLFRQQFDRRAVGVSLRSSGTFR